jgi:nicotinamidase-related amidase
VFAAHAHEVCLRPCRRALLQVCVQTSMREANDRGYECLLVTDATDSYFPHFKEAAIEMIQAQGGIVGWTADTAAVEAALAAA